MLFEKGNKISKIFKRGRVEKYIESEKNSENITQYETKIYLSRLTFFASFHIYALCYFYFIFTFQTYIKTFVFQFVLSLLVTVCGVSAGAHRLWSHKSYKARWPLKLFLVMLNTMALQMPILYWVRVHRLHHKYLDTDADPINAKRGLIFSHIGWFFVEEHPDVIEKSKTIDLGDMENDPLIVYQEKLIVPLAALFCIVLPTWIPMYFWNESFLAAWFSMSFKNTLIWNFTFTINSLAHKLGSKPYESSITSTDNMVLNWLILGEGWHNYHHVFPWDYKSADEHEGVFNYNPAARFIELCAWLGLAYDLKTPSEQLKRRRMMRTGDGSLNHLIWGWGDKDIEYLDKKLVEISKPSNKML